MFDRVFSIVLILNATSLFTFVAPQLGVTVGTVSLFLLALNALYLLFRFKYLAALCMHSGVLAWFLVLVCWPLATLLYAPTIETREIALRLYAFSLFLGALVFTLSNGLEAMHRVITASLVIALAGMAMSLIKPEYFDAVAQLTQRSQYEMGRAFGFAMEPNILSHTLIYLFVAWFSMLKPRTVLTEVLAILGFLGAVLLTGSRTGAVVAGIIVVLILGGSWRMPAQREKLILKVCLLGIFVAVGVLGIRFYISNWSDAAGRQDLDLAERVESIVNFRMSKEAAFADAGARGRFAAQTAYWEYIAKRPLTGYGLGASEVFHETGKFLKAAHSEALKRGFEFGLLFPAAFCALMLSLYFRRGRRQLEDFLQTNSVTQFVCALLLLFVVNGDLLDSRTFYVVWAMLFAGVYFPRRLFVVDGSSGRLSEFVARKRSLRVTSGQAFPVPLTAADARCATRNRAMRVLHVIPALSAGGAEGFVTHLAAEQARTNVDVRVFTLAGIRRERGRALLALLENAGVRVIGTEERAPMSIKNLLCLLRLIGTWRPDIVHAHLYASEVAAACTRCLLLFSDALYVRTLHSTNIRGYRAASIVRMLNRFFDVTVACSPSVEKAYLEFMAKTQLPTLRTINNGGQMLDHAPGADEKHRARANLSIPQDAFVVAHVGRIGGGAGHNLQSEPKAQDTLLRAFAAAFSDTPEALLVLVGDGPLRAEAEALANSLGIQAQVLFLGEQPEPWQALRSADLFCFPSRYEGLPLVLVEAASCGLPIVASDIPEIRTLAVHGEWLLRTVDDERGFADAMKEIRADLGRFAASSRCAAETFRKEYSMNTCAKRYLQAYDEARGGHAGADGQ